MAEKGKKKVKTENPNETKGNAKKHPAGEKKKKTGESRIDEKTIAEKIEAKKEEPEEKKVEAKKGEEKKVAAKKKFIPKAEKMEVKKSAEALEIQKTLKEKKWHPVFRGRFGKKCIRRKSIRKWDKWRKNRSIDSDTSIRHGFRPKIGYGNPSAIKGAHPSGYFEIRVCNAKDLEKINPKTEAARISATIGKRKRNEIVSKANEMKIKILN